MKRISFTLMLILLFIGIIISLVFYSLIKDIDFGKILNTPFGTGVGMGVTFLPLLLILGLVTVYDFVCDLFDKRFHLKAEERK